MADDESSHRAAFSGACVADEPAAKRSKITPPDDRVFRSIEAEPFSYVSPATESREAAVNCEQRAEREAKPAMAGEQAAAGGDNNGLGLLGCEPPNPAERLSFGFGSAEGRTGEYFWFPDEGLRVFIARNGWLLARRTEDERNRKRQETNRCSAKFSFLFENFADFDHVTRVDLKVQTLAELNRLTQLENRGLKIHQSSSQKLNSGI